MARNGRPFGRATSRTRRGSIDLTAVYTGLTWWWAGFDCADLLHVPGVRPLFWVTNAALSLLRLLRPVPLLAHGLVQRHALIDGLLEESGATRVLEGAAGFSPRGLSWSRDSGVDYVEIDRPAMVEAKLKLLKRSRAGQDVASRPNWRMLPGDLLTIDLSNIHQGEESVFLITEGLLMYLSAEQQRALWQRLAAYLAGKPGSIYVFDLVPGAEQEDGGAFGRLLGNIMRWFTGGIGLIEDRRDRQEISRVLRSCGFGSVRALEPRDADPGFRIPHLEKHTHVVVFVCRVSRPVVT